MMNTQVRSPLANSNLPLAESLPSEVQPAGPSEVQPAAMKELLRDHFAFVWRSLRRLGLDEGLADDGAQEVFLIASRKQALIEPGRERSFLFGTAVRVAADMRKKVARRREVSQDSSVETVDPAPSPEALLDQRRARALLDELLDELPHEIRPVFILYELEGLEMQEIAELLSLPRGTVASRLRRGRATFAAAAKRKQARSEIGGGER
jgi:RNA polymerase sigma-70 factor (ECF subfamily)